MGPAAGILPQYNAATMAAASVAHSALDPTMLPRPRTPLRRLELVRWRAGPKVVDHLPVAAPHQADGLGRADAGSTRVASRAKPVVLGRPCGACAQACIRGAIDGVRQHLLQGETHTNMSGWCRTAVLFRCPVLSPASKGTHAAHPRMHAHTMYMYAPTCRKLMSFDTTAAVRWCDMLSHTSSTARSWSSAWAWWWWWWWRWNSSKAATHAQQQQGCVLELGCTDDRNSRGR